MPRQDRNLAIGAIAGACLDRFRRGVRLGNEAGNGAAKGSDGRRPRPPVPVLTRRPHCVEPHCSHVASSGPKLFEDTDTGQPLTPGLACVPRQHAVEPITPRADAGLRLDTTPAGAICDTRPDDPAHCVPRHPRLPAGLVMGFLSWNICARHARHCQRPSGVNHRRPPALGVAMTVKLKTGPPSGTASVLETDLADLRDPFPGPPSPTFLQWFRGHHDP